MRFIRKKRYYFSDDSIASDTIISDVMGGISLLIELVGIISSFVTRGKVHEIFGTLYLCAAILTFVGIVFGYLGYKSQEGGVKSKRISLLINIISGIIIIWIMILGLK